MIQLQELGDSLRNKEVAPLSLASPCHFPAVWTQFPFKPSLFFQSDTTHLLSQPSSQGKMQNQNKTFATERNLQQGHQLAPIQELHHGSKCMHSVSLKLHKNVIVHPNRHPHTYANLNWFLPLFHHAPES
jgi:hypothetical protein